MAKFRKRPCMIEAIRPMPGDRIGLVLPTLEGVMLAREGDWIIKGVLGEFYPCKDDAFRETYEEVAPHA